MGQNPWVVGAVAWGLPARARTHHERALAIAIPIAAPREEARAYEGLGRCQLQDGQHEQGVVALRKAQEIYQHIGSPRALQIEAALDDPGA